MPIPRPTKIFRIIHINNLDICLTRGGLYAPNHIPDDGLLYHTIHNEEIQDVRRRRDIPCGPGGTVHDYVPFYFGPRSPMLLQLHTGRVEGYTEGQEPIIYLVSSVEIISNIDLNFVFSDGHGIASFTEWFDDLSNLNKIDWDTVYANQWSDTLVDMDRQRRKQAEFLVHQFCPFRAIKEIGVINLNMQNRVREILNNHENNTPVNIHQEWYY